MTTEARQLAVLRDLARTLDVRYWLRGGWALDFALGHPTRPHEDIDLLAWADDREHVETRLATKGFGIVERLEGQTSLTKDGESVQVVYLRLRADESVVTAAAVFADLAWPSGMLGADVGRIGSLELPIVSPAAQLEVKLRTPELLGRAVRPKDADDIRLLRELLG